MLKDLQNSFHISSINIQPSLPRWIKEEIDYDRVNFSAMAYEVTSVLKVYGLTTDMATLDNIYCFGVIISNCFGDKPVAESEFFKSFTEHAEGRQTPAIQIFEHAFHGKSFASAYDSSVMPN